ncbi:bifunctional glycosyltransferase family 2/GtrA family protein [Indiicoccus explosivorum]|uniref:bifunctional glycosyltransferase family 2/GtrA family protein n=1 Tax=Indiicoccus explosivorum TaxID=1917864 RepID=UPI000B43F658|nr:bifunctional glycosyltransferase family 2/GtrA family protein [Indiicoccus explosivorum]
MEQIAIIIPSYRPDEKCGRTVRGLADAGFSRIIVIDDGSGPEYEEIFSSIRELPEVTLLRHAVNQGKGRALKTAFHYILNGQLPLKAVITADADGQHLVPDIMEIARQLTETEDRLILGARDFSQKHVPFRSRFGNVLTRLLFRYTSGTWLTDTQTGLRGIPVQHLPFMLAVPGERFEYEMNVLAALGETGIHVREIKIETVYHEKNKSSHFRPLHDSYHVYKVFLKYGLSALVSFGLDIVLFWLFTEVWRDDAPELFIVFAAVSARVLSSLFNYFLNRYKVFRKGSHYSLIRYFVLAGAFALISGGIVQALYTEVFRDGEVALKIIVDTALFLLGFIIQRMWVFKEE